MAVELVDQRSLLVLHVVQVDAVVLAARAHETRSAAATHAVAAAVGQERRRGDASSLATCARRRRHRRRQRTERAANGTRLLLDHNRLAQAQRQAVRAGEPIEEQVVGPRVDEQVRLAVAAVAVGDAGDGVAVVAHYLARLVELEREGVEGEGAYEAAVVADPQVGARRVEAHALDATRGARAARLLHAVLVDEYAGGEVVDLDEALRVARQYVVLVERLEAAAEHLRATRVLEHAHLCALAHLPDARRAVQAGRDDQIVRLAPLHVHDARLVAVELVDHGGRTRYDLADDERAVQRARGEQALVVVGETDARHGRLVVVAEDVVNAGGERQCGRESSVCLELAQR